MTIHVIAAKQMSMRTQLFRCDSFVTGLAALDSRMMRIVTPRAQHGKAVRRVDGKESL